MKLIHFSDTHLGFIDLDTLLNASNCLCPLKLHTYAIQLPYIETLFLEYFLFSILTILKIFDEDFGRQDENRRIESLEAFHPIKNNTDRKP